MAVPVPVPVPISSYPTTIAHIDVSPLTGSSAQPHQTSNQEQGYSSKTMSNLAAETHSRILTSQLQPRLHLHEWLEYHLPDGMFYYIHPTRKLVTDLNLRRDGVLDQVTAWIDEDGREGESVGVFVEGWIVEGVATPGHGNGYGNGHGSYNYEYRGVRRGGGPKGKRQSMLRNGNASRRSDDYYKTDKNGIETRVISRILIRVALWHQTYFRPHKALSIDTHLHASNGLVSPNQAIRGQVRVRRRRYEESKVKSYTYHRRGVVHPPPPSPSSIPSLSYFSRISILVSFATLSLATTGIAFLHHKSEMEDSSSSSMASQMHRFNEEKRIITVRNLVLSAPVVLLSYSIIAFLFAIITHTLPTLSFWFTSIVHFIL
ncbi:hypothetical protein BJ165DRAFT_1409822 [Panaeolus papilionaceus]|nr:hypothetical protein BJ165DRAFT_1409822 [Panaeolus papilionaceus]